MIALVVLLVAIAVLIGLGFAFGGPALAVLGALAGALVVGYFVFMALSRRTPAEGDAARRGAGISRPRGAGRPEPLSLTLVESPTHPAGSDLKLSQDPARKPQNATH